MRAYFLILMILPVMALQACSTGAGQRYSGQARVGAYEVKWARFTGFEKQVPKGLTPLIFSFSSTRPADNNGVTEADWERTAAKFGMGVSDTKSSFGGAAYKGPDGDLRICTVIAIRKGFCGKSRGLSEEKRVAFAQKALGGSLQCRWVGFDAGYNRAASRLMGAEEYILNVAADCR